MIVRMMDRFHSKAYYNLSATKKKKEWKTTRRVFFMFRFGLVGLFAANSSIIVLIGSVEDTGQPLLEDNQISGGSIITLYYTSKLLVGSLIWTKHVTSSFFFGSLIRRRITSEFNLSAEAPFWLSPFFETVRLAFYQFWDNATFVPHFAMFDDGCLLEKVHCVREQMSLSETLSKEVNEFVVNNVVVVVVDTSKRVIVLTNGFCVVFHQWPM